MKKLLPLFCVFLLFCSCKKENRFVFEDKTFAQKTTLPCEDKNCTEAVIKIPVFRGKNEAIDMINKNVFSIVTDIIAFDTENATYATYDDVLKSFIHSYDDIKQKFPNEPIPWEAKITTSCTVFNDKIVNIVFDYYTFTGGAHGNPGIISVFYDLKTGKEVVQKDLFINYEGFKKLVKKIFYQQNNLAADVSLNDNGFIFEENTFYLPQNIIITEKEVIAHYNHYEIAPYSDGPTDIRFSYDEVKPYLNELYFK